MPRVLLGGEGVEGGGRRERQRAGLRSGASCRGGVCCRLRDAEGEETRGGVTFHFHSDADMTDVFKVMLT